jgi:vitamin B12 transporter
MLLWLALVWGASAWAVSPSDAVGDEEEVSVEVTTTTPNRLDQPLNEVSGAGSITVLTKPEIDAQQPLSVPEVLRNVPGLGLLESGTLGESASIKLRGAESFQTLVLLDGVRINQPFRGFAELGNLLLDGIDQIEVVRGAHSALYGTDAIGGVVNFRMLPPQRPSEVTFFAGGGTFRTAREGVDVALSCPAPIRTASSITTGLGRRPWLRKCG